MMIYIIIFAAILTRFIPHLPNIAPITALAIFGAVYLPKKQAIAIPLAARFISDLFLGFFQWQLMVAVYACHLVGILFGLWIRKSTTPSASQTPLLFQEGNAPQLSSDNYGVSPPKIGGVPDEVGGGGMNRWVKIIGASLGASVIFFLVTNFAFFYPYYSHNIFGILAAYTNGLPFFRGTLFGDLSYTVALFGSYQFARFLARQKSKKELLKNLA